MVENRRDLTERVFSFAVQIVNLCRLLDERAGVPRTMANQLLRSGTSIGANIHEGQGSQSEADFLTKYCIACKEAYETQYWLKLLVATELLPEEKVSEIRKECDEIVGDINDNRKETQSQTNRLIRFFSLYFSLFPFPLSLFNFIVLVKVACGYRTASGRKSIGNSKRM